VPAIKLDNENIGGHLTPLHSILYHFRNKARYWPKIVIVFIPLCIRRPR